MQLGRFDAMLNFGEVELTSGEKEFPNVLFLDKADAQRMSVAATLKEKATGGTSVILKLKGSNDNAIYTDISTSASVSLAELENGVSVSIPNGYNKKYLKLFVSCTGTFTSGKLEAGIDTYTGV